MLKKLSDFVVEKRVAVLIVMLVLALAGVICTNFVTINEDMTKYLPDESNMKAGMDIMAEAFPEMATSNSIRVMFDDLTDEDKSAILEKIKAIEHVDSVDHDPVSADYNKDNHTLFVINMSCDYESKEEKAIEKALKTEFDGYTVAWQNNDTSSPGVPAMVIVVVMIIIFAILFTMCGSWFEPFLFLVTIGIAIVINSGTNIFLGEIAGITNSISALLQMILSMDYSIIMMNRYRQERQLEPDKIKAMKTAWKNAFPSVSSSSLTTVVGLLMLIFMSFKIGADLGIVLAKGVFISMLCVVTILPALILICDNILVKTAKKEPHIPMNWAAKFSHKSRRVLTGVFAVLFAGFYILQNFTGIAYTLVRDDAVADVFPKSNMLVMVYNNKDEDKLDKLVANLENDEKVTSIMSYGTILGKPYTSEELVGVIEEMSSGFTLNSSMIDMLYYHYYTDGVTGTMTMSDFFTFISGTIANDEAFSGYISEDMTANMDRIGMFTDKSELTKQRTPEELATMLDIDVSMAETIFTLHNAQNVSYRTMTVSQFVEFLNGDLLNNPMFADKFDSETKAQLKTMETMVKYAVSGESLTPAQTAAALGMDETQVGQLYYLYYSTDEAFQQEAAAVTMTIPAFLTLIKENAPEEQQLILTIMDTIGSAASSIGLLKSEMSASSFANMFGIDESQVLQLFGLHIGKDKTIPFAQFASFLATDVVKNEEYAAYFEDEQKTQLATMNKLVQYAASGTKLNAKTLADAVGIEEEMINMVFRLYFGSNITGKTLALEETVDFILADSVMTENMDAEMLGMLQKMQVIVKSTLNEEQLTAAQMGDMFSGLTEDFDPASIETMYMFSDSIENADPTWTMTLETLFNHMVNNVIEDARFSAFIDDEMKSALLENKVTLEDGKKQLMGEEYSRLIITSVYPDESDATTAFLTGLETYASDNMSEKTYLIGESAMTLEMQRIFDTELLFITMLTAIAIFFIVMLTFRSLSIPLILVLLVQCGVYITVTVTGLLGGEIYFLALLIVECILMGATIDYGILFTNYYCESRKTMDIREALAKAYDGSIHTIMTSGLILVGVTAVVGQMFEDATIAAIVGTISIGSFCAIMLILFVLPGILATCDKLVIRKKHRIKNHDTKTE